MPDTDIDTSNLFFVGVLGPDLVVLLRPVPQQLTRDQARNLAAWLAVMADDINGDEEKFDALRDAVRNT